jgi:hypothetical protein
VAVQPFMGKSTTSVQIPAGASTKTILVSPGRLGQIAVTATGTASGLVEIFDGIATTVGDVTTVSGNILAVIPANATAGTLFTFDMPCAFGLTVVNIADGPAFSVAWH